MSRVRPTWRVIGRTGQDQRHQRRRRCRPRPAASRSRPRRRRGGPRRWRAAGATAPPNSTANRSREIAPSRIGWRRMNRRPSRASCSRSAPRRRLRPRPPPTSSSADDRRGTRTVRIRTDEARNSDDRRVGRRRVRRRRASRRARGRRRRPAGTPPTSGRRATAGGPAGRRRRAGRATAGAAKARPTPKTTATPKIGPDGGRLRGGVPGEQQRADRLDQRAERAEPPAVVAVGHRAGDAARAAPPGANSARPSRPRSISLPGQVEDLLAERGDEGRTHRPRSRTWRPGGAPWTGPNGRWWPIRRGPPRGPSRGHRSPTSTSSTPAR